MGFLKGIFNVRRSEIPLVLLMFLYFFLVIAIFWILKPLKKDAFVTFYDFDEKTQLGRSFYGLDGPEAEQIAKVGNMGVAFIAVVVFTILARKFHRHQLTTIFAAFTVVVLAFFAFTIESGGEVTRWSFYLFGDLFNTLMVATFFVFLNDSVKPADSKRLYGPIVLGGVAGGAIGSTFLRALIKKLSVPQWMWVCIGLTVVVALLAIAAGKLVDKQKAAEPEPAKPAESKPAPASNPAVEGAKLVIKSRYLLSIVTIVALYEIVSTILDFQFTATLYGLLPDNQAKEQLSTVYAITNWTGLAIQVFATTFVMQRFGIKIALLIMPCAIFLNSAAFLVLPILWTGSLLNTTDNALNYSLNQSSREALWTPTTRDEKYKAKAFIDMFVQRFAKAIAVGINLLMASLFVGIEGVRWLSIFVVVLVAVWLLAAAYAGKQFEDMTKDK